MITMPTSKLYLIIIAIFFNLLILQTYRTLILLNFILYFFIYTRHININISRCLILLLLFIVIFIFQYKIKLFNFIVLIKLFL
jgi:hypothetical protein